MVAKRDRAVGVEQGVSALAKTLRPPCESHSVLIAKLHEVSSDRPSVGGGRRAMESGVKQAGPRRCFAPGGSGCAYSASGGLWSREGMARARPAAEGMA